LSNKGKLWLRAGVSVGLLAALLIWAVDLPTAGRALAGARWQWLAALLLVMTADRWLMSAKWRLLLKARGYEAGSWEALKAYYLATFAGSILPSTLGADAMRIGSFSRPGRPSEAVAASIFMERTLGFVAAAVAALMALVLLARVSPELPPELFWVALGLAAAGVAALACSLTAAVARLGGRLEGRGRLLGWLARFAAAYGRYRDHKAVLAWFLLLSLLEQGAPVVCNWLSARALGIELSLVESAAVTPVAILLARLPVSVSSFGMVEGLYVAFFGLVGVAATSAFLLGLALNLGSLISALPAVPFYLLGGVKAQSPPPLGPPPEGREGRT
jgi:uncharacterized protein (TIRG00374 family)